MMNDALHVVHPRAAGLEVHKVETTARVYRDPSTDDEALMVNRPTSRWLRKPGHFGILEPRGDGSLRVNRDSLKAAPRRA